MEYKVLDYTKKLTSEEIWHGLMLKRLLQLATKLEDYTTNAQYQIKLASVTPTDEKIAFFSLDVSGGRCPLTYHFRVAAENGMSFRITPTSPLFHQNRKIEKEDYGLNALGGDIHLTTAFTMDLIDNYNKDQEYVSPFDARVTYARKETPQPS